MTQLMVDYYIENSFARKYTKFESSILHSIKFFVTVHERFDHPLHFLSTEH